MRRYEIPLGRYCYDQNGVCPYWEKTGNGARCHMINEEHFSYCGHHLVWDQVKECGINREEVPSSISENDEGWIRRMTTCPCGRSVENLHRV